MKVRVEGAVYVKDREEAGRVCGKLYDEIVDGLRQYDSSPAGAVTPEDVYLVNWPDVVADKEEQASGTQGQARLRR